MSGAQEQELGSIVIARMQVTMEHQAKAMDRMTMQMEQLGDTINGNHDAIANKVVAQQNELIELRTTLKVSRFWIGVCMSIFLGVSGVLSWATAKFWDNLTRLNDWKVQSQLRWDQHDRQQNYGNEARTSYPETRGE
jgi:hypothetical protein